jgi:GNAT superfamily N-acetyltransferase
MMQPMSAEIVIQRPTAAHLAGIRVCLAAYRFHCFGEGDVADPDFPADAILTVRNAIHTVDLADRAWVVLRDGEVLGFCCWDWLDRAAGSAKTVLISVLPAARSLGVGSRLQQRRMDEMRAAGAREIHTWSDEAGAIRWYQERFGYRLEGYEPIHHAVHRFILGGETFWGIHRGFRESSQLAHLVCR